MRRYRLTLRQRIFFSMLLLILVSFALTGAISFYHFKSENEQYHQERLRRKEYAVNESIDYFLSNQPITENTDSIVKLFDNKICELADINNMDINIYGLGGSLLISSNPLLYEEQIISEQLSSSLLKAISKNPDQLLVKTKNDSLKLDYLSTYNIIRNAQKQPIAIVNLPYFDTQDIHREDLTDFLITLSQIYLVLFLVSGLFAYLLSNYITGSLNAIALELKKIRLGGNNERLKWRFDDEIGTLVDEYNRMLNELEVSAVKLAQTERESAWKEMARQVAHEIKNPLTPMRLNVQYLERTLKTENQGKLKEFTQSMVEQIDALSNIAEAFSRFATMPGLKAEEFSLKELLQRVTALYADYNISFNTDHPEATISADKDQLLRVMNNLITNAIQAVPDEREAQIRVGLHRTEEGAQIRVRDNGVGISAEQGDQIFEPRFTTKTKGMGLGLAMVKKIVDSFNGKIWFESEPNKGTTFFVNIPSLNTKVIHEKT
jgi:two-component system nitrogen regulation sensor histidine kinase NtrY